MLASTHPHGRGILLPSDLKILREFVCGSLPALFGGFSARAGASPRVLAAAAAEAAAAAVSSTVERRENALAGTGPGPKRGGVLAGHSTSAAREDGGGQDDEQDGRPEACGAADGRPVGGTTVHPLRPPTPSDTPHGGGAVAGRALAEGGGGGTAGAVQPQPATAERARPAPSTAAALAPEPAQEPPKGAAATPPEQPAELVGPRVGDGGRGQPPQSPEAAWLARADRGRAAIAPRPALVGMENP